jgi:hypothetical protein
MRMVKGRNFGWNAHLYWIMTERRFDEAEVAAIFEKAAEAQHTRQRQLPSGEGMTLAELQQIGREIGIDPQLVTQAARSLEAAGRPTSRRLLGLPIGVGRTIDLGRKLSDAEWEQLVVDLRETFDARGSIRQEGSFRQWTNGNLQALLEPTSTGHRLRLKTMKGDAVGWIAGGLGMLGAAAALFIAAMTQGGSAAELLTRFGAMATIGAGMFSLGALRLPSWSRTRRRQMEEIAGRLAEKALPPDRRGEG